jgi:hypothetical protein
MTRSKKRIEREYVGVGLRVEEAEALRDLAKKTETPLSLWIRAGVRAVLRDPAAVLLRREIP